MKLLTLSLFLILAVVSPILAQPWVPVPNPQAGWMPWIWMDRFQANVENSRVNGPNINLIFYGDSIVEGWPAAIWNRAFAPLGAANYGIGGDLTQHVLWRIINGEVNNTSPRLIVIKIGTNNIGGPSPADIAQGIEAILNELRDRLPTTRILLLGILPRTNAAQTALAESVNQIISQHENLNTVRFLNMRDSFYGGNGQFFLQLFSSATAPLHLSNLGYLTWEETMWPLFDQMWNMAPLQ